MRAKAHSALKLSLRNRLAERLNSRFHDEPPQSSDTTTLCKFYDRLEPDEKELHSIIRAYTEHVVQPLNAEMRTWLQQDVEYRMSRGKKGVEATLCQQLNTLDAHLLLWLAKYEAWIPGHPDHALVYLADEEEHGQASDRDRSHALESARTSSLMVWLT